ncbi:MAG TPA: NAD(P)/FAD-dependent oxidoreductase [Xanthobacteraceae bacterium]|jgi:2-polyprenyl-6-methoxyphenol hydroxylase-like FAD-dependent oxidoreductase|nr:NAD(P)/FAD-dependent oxidoreductase [Xanthobacteraceae bacterium]
MMRQADRVIVVGAGPVGAVTALALVKKGIPVTLIEAEAEPPEDQRAATIHPPTVEMLAELGLKDEAFAEDASGGLLSPIFHFRDRVTGELVAVFDISLLEGEVPYPFVVQWEQYKLVRAARPHIEASGIAEIRFSTKVTDLAQGADYVEVTVAGAERESERLCGRYVIGADGGRSTVRRLSEIEFEGFTWPERFIKIGTSFDFGATGRGFCTRNYFSDPNEWLNLFKVKGSGPPGIWRGIMPVPAEESDQQALSMESIQRRLHGIHPKPGDYGIPYHALYSVHQRVAATFNKGRVLLAGDAAHVNNPIGGMGMNGGIHDAMNLTAKLADVWFGRAGPEVFDRYTRQRLKAQVDYVQAQTIQNKRSLEEKDPVIRRKHLDELRRISEDVKLHKQFLYHAGLFDSLNSANAVE